MTPGERFFRAIGKGDEPTAMELLRAHPELAGETGAVSLPIHNCQAPALVMAAELGLDTMAAALLDAGAAVEVRGFLGGMAMHWAAWYGHSGIVERMLKAGSPLEAHDTEFHCTPLFWAAHGFSYRSPAFRRDQLGAARLLLQAGARTDVHNREGTPVLSILEDPADAPMKSLIEEAANGGRR